MSPDDRTMLAFAVKWSPFGGGDEYILPEFGLTTAVFYQRPLAMVTTTLLDEVDFATRTFLRQFCVSKLSHATQPAPLAPDNPIAPPQVRPGVDPVQWTLGQAASVA